MAKLLIGSIDLNKIDKTKIITKDKHGNSFKNGAKYYNIAVWLNDTIDEYGNIASIQESISKEEKDSGKKGTYIGNLKNIQGQNLNNNNNSSKEVAKPKIDNDDDLPF